jgi:hypothetical protein
MSCAACTAGLVRIGRAERHAGDATGWTAALARIVVVRAAPFLGDAKSPVGRPGDAEVIRRRLGCSP